MQQRLVAELGAQPGEAGGELGVEEVRDARPADAAQQRDVLAAGVHDDLDLRVGEHLGERREVERVVERVEHLDAHVAAGARRLDGDLDEAQQRLVAALAHELRVDAEAPGRAGELGERRDVSARAQVAQRSSSSLSAR